jgi:hypothetical protein
VPLLVVPPELYTLTPLPTQTAATVIVPVGIVAKLGEEIEVDGMVIVAPV